MITTWRMIAATALASAIFLSGCATPPPSRSQLTDLLQQNLIHIPDKNFESLPPEVKQKDVVFLGEGVHHLGELWEAGARLAVYLASDRPVVYAKEAVYGLHPFFEAASHDQPVALPIPIPPQIKALNAQHDPNHFILMTTVDIEHSVYHSKHYTVAFLGNLADRSISKAARDTLIKEIPKLIDANTFEKSDTFLQNLENTFQQYIDTFSPEDQDEIRFSMELLRKSNLYQYASRDSKMRIRNHEEIRIEYFIKTIQRAYQKAQKSNAILLCNVGNWHASYTHTCECRYFARDYALTKGKVFAIQMIPLYEDSKKKESGIKDESCDMDSAVNGLMKEGEYCYLPLKQLQTNVKQSLKWSKYYPRGKPICDGLLFVKIKKEPKP